MDQSPDEMREPGWPRGGNADFADSPHVETRRGGGSDVGRSPEEMLGAIEQTRTDMAETVEEIRVKLAPDRLRRRAKELARAATIGRVEKAVESTVQSGEQAINNAGEVASEVGDAVVETVKQNPIPSLIAGASVSWLLMSSESCRRSSRFTSDECEEGTAVRPGDVIRRNPIPSALVGVGLAWLAFNALSPREERWVRFEIEVGEEAVRPGEEMTYRTLRGPKESSTTLARQPERE